MQAVAVGPTKRPVDVGVEKTNRRKMQSPDHNCNAFKSATQHFLGLSHISIVIGLFFCAIQLGHLRRNLAFMIGSSFRIAELWLS